MSDELFDRMVAAVVARIKVPQPDKGDDGTPEPGMTDDEKAEIINEIVIMVEDRIDVPDETDVTGIVRKVLDNEPPLTLQPTYYGKSNKPIKWGTPITIPRDGTPGLIPPFGIESQSRDGTPKLQSAPLGGVIPLRVLTDGDE
jgi:hypothetical protein